MWFNPIQPNRILNITQINPTNLTMEEESGIGLVNILDYRFTSLTRPTCNSIYSWIVISQSLKSWFNIKNPSLIHNFSTCNVNWWEMINVSVLLEPAKPHLTKILCLQATYLSWACFSSKPPLPAHTFVNFFWLGEDSNPR